jgi:hypothetical protein
MSDEIVVANTALSWFAGSGTGSMLFVDSIFGSDARDSQASLLSFADEAQVVLRGCAVENVNVVLQLPEGCKLGIVNSTFESALVSNLSITPPTCGDVVADRAALSATPPMAVRVCDPRADCSMAPTGGVECRCEGTSRRGLSQKEGARTDGSECFQTLVLESSLVSQIVNLKVDKPGSATAPDGKTPLWLIFKVHAAGEKAFVGMHTTRVSLHPRPESVRPPSHGSDGAPFGQVIQWQNNNTQSIPLPFDPLRSELDIQSRLLITLQNCSQYGRLCAADGDAIETSLAFVVDSGEISLGQIETRVTIRTEVRALPSCMDSSTKLEMRTRDGIIYTGPLLHDTSFLQLILTVVDVDKQPISFSTPFMNLTWDGETISPTKPVADGNSFVFTIDMVKRSTASAYQAKLVVHGWNELAGAAGLCTLFEEAVVVEAGQQFNTVWVLVGAGCTSVLLVAVVLVWAKRNSLLLQHILLMVLTEATRLVLSTVFELGNVATE